MLTTMQNCVVEIPLGSAKRYEDPFNEVEVDAIFETPEGAELKVPAFWTGSTWRVRYASGETGRHVWRTVCSDEQNADVHGQTGELEVTPYDGRNPLLQHGPLRVSENGRYLEHADGRPFFWLADTWWMGLCSRLHWPGEFRTLTFDRLGKGFNVIQIVAGLYPDMVPFDRHGANEAGFPWERDYVRINPSYWDCADLRISFLVDCGLVPAVVGSWGYFIEFAGAEVLKKHWRNLIARWGAWPVMWCVAGEVLMPWYLSSLETQEARAAWREKAQAGWSEVGRYIKETDPWGRLLTAHPGGGQSPREILGEELVDLEWLQTGHGDRESLPGTVRYVTERVAHQPRMPVINSEVCYEGIGEASRQEVQRLMFWACVLNGAAGHSYGANGIWQVNRRSEPFGPSPHGMSWGSTPWDVASQLPGSAQLGYAKRLLERYEWWRLEARREEVEPHWSDGDFFQPYAAEIPGECRIIYLPRYTVPKVLDLEPDRPYLAFYLNPADGTDYTLGEIRSDEKGVLRVPKPPVYQDWILVVEL